MQCVARFLQKLFHPFQYDRNVHHVPAPQSHRRFRHRSRRGLPSFIYRLANQCALVGFIANTPAGVSIEVEGRPEDLDEFLQRLPKEVPPLAKLTALAEREIDLQGEQSFRIITTR